MSDLYGLVSKAEVLLDAPAALAPGAGEVHRAVADAYLRAAELLVRAKEAS